MTSAVVRTNLNYKNYDNWSSQIKTYLLSEDLWDIIDQGRPKTEDEESKAWKKNDAKALYAIQKSCGDDTYELIKSATTASEAWNTLSSEILKKAGGPSNEKDERLVGEAYPTTTRIDDDTKLEVSAEEGRIKGAGHDEIQETFVKYVKSDEWDNAINFLRQHPEAATTTLPPLDGTALHYAIKKRCSVSIIQQLVDLMDSEDLEITDSLGSTALYYFISWFPEMFEVAECMVEKNHNLLTILPNWNNKPLVLSAQGNAKGERMARYLYSRTPSETIQVVDAAQLISNGFRLQRFDIAWDLIQRYPELIMAIDHDGNTPLATLASNRFAFKSGRPLSLWKKLIYDGISIKPLPSINKDSPIYVYQGPLAEQNENQRHHLISSGMSLFRRLVANLQTYVGINHIYQIKLVHERVQQFLSFMPKATNDYQEIKIKEALCMAAERGHVEYITHFLQHGILDAMNENNQSLFQIAVECRQYNVYNIICECLQKQDKDHLDKSKCVIPSDELIKKTVEYKDNLGNNILHTVARITPLSQIDHIQGAILQMQRELQWFKEVEFIAKPKDCESLNNNNKTPRKVFKENHKELGKEVEKSMKETATSCTVVGALIVTIMFAVAFTVPGGNDEKTHLPKLFTTFIVSDAISLFSSTTSVIMFLGILTSRYSENDFHKSLPTKMIIGLFTLFLSIATMMIVFSCGLYIILDGKSSIVIPSILLAGVPVASFIWMQFPLLKDLSISTFGRGVFDRKQKNLF